MKTKKKKSRVLDYVKANRKASREVELDNEKGFTSKNFTHKSKKKYTRKPKHKKS